MAWAKLLFVGIIPFALAVHLGARVDTDKEQLKTTTHHIDHKTPLRPKGFILSLSQPCNEICLSDVQEGLSEHNHTNLCTVDEQSISIEMLNLIRISCNSTTRHDRLHPGSTGVEKKTLIAAIRVALASNGIFLLRIKDEGIASITHPYHGHVPIQAVSSGAQSSSVWSIDEADGGFERDGLRTCADQSRAGEGVSIWILDTGCEATLGGRCVSQVSGDALEDCTASNFDGSGRHGTDIGLLATDVNIGLATKAQRNCVKVIGADGTGGMYSVMKGIQYVFRAMNKSRGNVINLSLAMNKTHEVNHMVEILGRMGVFVVSAAGNIATVNSCDLSPASAEGKNLFTVQAHDINGTGLQEGSFAELERDCASLTAPGVEVPLKGGRKGDGTSFAAAYVSGAIAVLLSDNREVTVQALTEMGREIAFPPEGVEKRSLGLGCTRGAQAKRVAAGDT